MPILFSRPSRIALALIAAPFLLFGLYVASLVAPIVVRAVVPVVVQAVEESPASAVK